MKKIILLFVIILLCGCSKQESNINDIQNNVEHSTYIEKTTTQVTSITAESKKASTTSKITTTTSIKNEVVNTTKNITSTTTNNFTNTTTTTSNIKYVNCYAEETNDTKGYYGKTTTKATFVDNELSYFTMSIIKKYNDGYNANDDSAFKDITDEKINSVKGRTGSIRIEDNTIYYTLNYDMNLVEDKSLVTTHTEYNDYVDKRKRDGWTCDV